MGPDCRDERLSLYPVRAGMAASFALAKAGQGGLHYAIVRGLGFVHAGFAESAGADNLYQCAFQAIGSISGVKKGGAIAGTGKNFFLSNEQNVVLGHRGLNCDFSSEPYGQVRAKRLVAIAHTGIIDRIFDSVYRLFLK